MSHVPMTLPDLALSVQSHPFSKNSSFAQLDDGRIVHANHHSCQTSDDGGLTWTKARLISDTNGDPVGGSNTSIAKLAGPRSIGMAARLAVDPPDVSYALFPGGGRKDKYSAMFWRSDDGGETWHPPVPMSPPGVNTAAMNDTLLRTSGGRLVWPVYICMGQMIGHDGRMKNDGPIDGKLVRNQYVNTGAHFYDPGFDVGVVLYSDDEGRTWHANRDGELVILLDWSAHYSKVNEASITEVVPGRLLMVMRSALGRLFQAWSDDHGETWTRPQPSPLASSEAPGQIRTLPNGHLLCIWNQDSEAEVRRGQNRTRISSAISRDGGRVWEFFQNIESIHETTRIEPGPIHPVRPEEIYNNAGIGAFERDGRFIDLADVHGRWMYPAALVMTDRVLVSYGCHGYYHDHPTRAELVRDGTGEISDETGGPMGQRRKVLPLNWFYGGKEPADNPFLRAAYEPARP